MKPSLRQLEYLIALQNTGSFSVAAQESHVTQSTLSAGIKELEMTLGQSVALRSKRAISLTPFGEEIATHARKILAQVGALSALAHTLAAPLTGRLRLGVIPTIAPYLLPALLPLLQTKYPDLELQIFEDLSARLVNDMHNDRLDLILLAFPYDTPGMYQTTLWHEDFLLATATPPKSKALNIHTLSNQDLLLLEDGHCLRDHALSACHLAPPAARRTFSATSLPTLIQMVANGYGTTLLPEMVVQTGLPDTIKTIPFNAPRPSREIGLAWKDNHPKIKDFEILAKMIKNAYKSAS